MKEALAGVGIITQSLGPKWCCLDQGRGKGGEGGTLLQVGPSCVPQ